MRPGASETNPQGRQEAAALPQAEGPIHVVGAEELRAAHGPQTAAPAVPPQVSGYAAACGAIHTCR